MATRPITLGQVRGFLLEEYERAFRHDHWHVGIVDAPIHAFLEPDAKFDVHWLPLPEQGKYYADPFGLVRGGAAHILFEEFDYGTNRGIISWVREEADGRFSAPTPALELPFHVSYPFLIEQAGSVYCVPETGEAHEIALYKAVEFPHRWAKAATLVRGVAGVDNTIFKHDGRFWLFCTDLGDGPFSKLRVWYAPDLVGPWTPHPANPVKDDVRSARPAGTPFSVDGELYRPAQDSSSTYGGAIVLNRIVALTTTEYREEEVTTIGPFRDAPHTHGIHTLSSMGDRTLVDGKRFAFDGRAMARNLRESIGGRWPRALLAR